MKTLCNAATGRALLFMATASVAACTGSLFQSAASPPSTYLLSAKLDASSFGSPVEAVAVDLAVQVPRARAGLANDRIAVLYPDRRLDYFADARWSGPLDQVVQDLALQAFATGGHLRTVSAEASAFPSGYWLEIQIEEFQAEYASTEAAPVIHVHLTARLGRAGDRLVLESFDADVRQPASANRLGAVVEAYERAVDAALAEIVAGTSRTLALALKYR